MYPLFELSGFHLLSEEQQLDVLEILMDALTQINLIWLETNPSAPLLYDLKPRYIIKPRPFAIDSWQDMATTIRKRTGDCKDFSAYRCAELLARGSRSKVRPRKIGEIFHFVVITDGVEEDPSEKLGMTEALHHALGLTP